MSGGKDSERRNSKIFSELQKRLILGVFAAKALAAGQYAKHGEAFVNIIATTPQGGKKKKKGCKNAAAAWGEARHPHRRTDSGRARGIK